MIRGNDTASQFQWHAVILIRDLIRRKKVYQSFTLVMKSQYYSKPELKCLQDEKLKMLIRHAYNTVPYYRYTMNKLKLTPNDFNSKADLVKLPILTKEIVNKKGMEQFITTKYSKSQLYFGTTGGSTGTPFVFCKDKNYGNTFEAYMLRHFSWCGWQPGDSIVRLWGKRINESRWSKMRTKMRQFLFKDSVFDSFKMSQERMSQYADRINEISPKVIRGYAHSLYLLAMYIRESARNLTIPACSSTAEMLFPHYREEIKSSLSARCFDQYGCGEIHNIAAECEVHDGLHVNDEHVIVEIVHNKEMASNVGELIVTDLDNYGMPFIRYKNGDIAKNIEGECSCGRELSRIGEIVGRISSSFITKTGTIVHGEFITHLLNELQISREAGIREFQMIQNDYDKYHLNLVSKRELIKSEIYHLTCSLKQYLGPITLNIDYFDTVPVTKSGKKQYTMSKVLPE